MTKSQNFNVFIKEYNDVIYKVCHSYTNNREDFEDYYQEICYQLWRSLDSFKGKSKLSTWVYRVALNVCFLQLKKKKRTIETSDFGSVDFVENDIDEKEENIQLLYTAIRRLSPTERALIILFLEGKSYKEMSEILGITVSNIGVKVNRTKSKLKKIMKSKID
ncbi:sigma-70 family RNA polymerase sigma factor [Flavobacteriaceae bacterium R38]|nr:sigma-70 family RNA polymerase sigma factor [Flavobacteriaceae bacterium R38]